MTSKLPFLPGYNVDVEIKTRHNKSHVFDVENGVRKEVALGGSEAIDPASIKVDPKGLTTNTWAGADFGGQRLPAWVAYDRKVLRFFAFFKEAVFSSAIETYRVRRCVIYYYLEDDSVHIAEPKVENSGIPQGVLIRRHRVPKADNSYLDMSDLAIGAELSVYGRVFKITDADAFTRDYYAKNGVELAPSLEAPVDSFTKRNTVEERTFKKLMHPMKEHMEASLGKQMGINIAATKKFLANDGKVLRFYCTFRDDKLFGEIRPFIVHYFLADDTVEVLEVKDANSGRDGCPALLKRQRLPKNFNDLSADCSAIGNIANDPSIKYYSEGDLKIGMDLIVYGRPLTIIGCDGFTKKFYLDNFGATEDDFPAITTEGEPDKQYYIEAPPHNGIGTEEDSLSSFIYLVPKIPKIDYRKMMENDGIILRYEAKFVNPASEDVNRRFIISFFMSNDTVQIFEKFQRNSGFIGGNFLERSRQTNLDNLGKYFQCGDFEVGKIVNINTFAFEIVGVDVYTEKFMQANASLWA